MRTGPRAPRLRLALLVALLCTPAITAGENLPFPRERGGPVPIGFDLPALRDAERFEDVYVVPRRAGQNRVRWYGFDFKEVLLPQLPGAGVRLFYYESARPSAEVAAAIIREQYLRLVRAFEYVPEREVPYVLYGTHHEFQATNVFPISEGVLGATSPADLTLALPFFGDLDQFRHTSTHELVHEFTIQAVKSHSEAADRPTALMIFPLWFIEGLAEYASFGGLDPDAQPSPTGPEGASGPGLPGLDPETEAWARDLLYQPSPYEGYTIFPFFSDFPRSYVHTYKLGQLRVAFLGSTFGRELILWLLRNAHHMVAGGGPFPGNQRTMGFPELLRLGTGLAPEEIQQLFDEWVRRRYLPAYADARTRVPAVHIVEDLPTEPESLTASPDGRVLMVRGIDRELGRSSLYLLDARDPSRHQRLVEDGRPGLESLHPISRRTFAVGNGWVAWIGRSGAGDVLTTARIERLPNEAGDLFRLREERTFDLVDADLLEAGDPTIAPDGTRIAFAAVDRAGFKDVYLLPLGEGAGIERLQRLTRTEYAESGLYWSDAGIYLASDATPDGDSNLFLLDPDTGAMRPIVADEFDKESPFPTPAGLLFASDRGGRWDIHRIEEDDTAYRLTDASTQLRWPVPGPGGSVYAILIHGGRFRLARIPPAELRRYDPRPALHPGYDASPRRLPRLGLPVDTAYDPFDHFGLDIGAVAVGTQSVAVGGLSFSDLLRDRIVAVQLAVYGDIDFTDASVIYLDRSRRLAWLAGVFHTFQPKRDRTFDTPAFPDDPDFYLERQYGVIGGLSWPFDRYRRVDLTLTLEGVDRSRFTDKLGLRSERWERETGGSEPQIASSLAFGLDTTRYHPRVGPVAGSSLLFRLGGGMLPQRFDTGEPLHGYTELDLQHWIYLGGRSTIWTRAAAGTGFGSRFSRQFYLSSIDNLRGYHWADERLLGDTYYVANLELSVPLDWLVQVALFEGLRGVAGADFGGVTDDTEMLWDVRSLNLLLGSDFLAGPLALRLLFGWPIQIGPVLPSDGWVTSFALRLRY